MRRAFTLKEMVNIAAPIAQSVGVPLSLLLALSQRESEWKPWAHRAEPHLDDASHGLTQILLSTARAQGYGGVVGAWDDVNERGTGLYDPYVNLRYGAMFLRSLIQRAGGDVERAVSAYNAGWGNARRAETTTLFCEQWKPTAPKTGRVLSRDCARIRTVQVGEWMNMPYVAGIMRAEREIRESVGGAQSGGVVPGGSGGSSQSTAAPSTDSRTSFVVNPVALIVVTVVGVLAWLFKRG